MVSQVENRLRALARRAAVAVQADPVEGAEFWGSGLLVAPEWVLTCAHVLVRKERTGRRRWAADRLLGLRVGERVLPGRAVYALPGPDELGGWELGDEREFELVPDLALIRLLEPAPDPYCAWLSDRAVPPVSGQVAAVGWRRPGRELEPWDGTCVVPGNDRIDVFRLGPDTEIPPGVSGSLVVDLAHGRVVGVVKARRRTRDGGKAVLLTALRALTDSEPLVPGLSLGPDPYQELIRRHDRWHYERHRTGGPDSTWTDIQGGLPDVIGEWTPFDRVEALGRLAALPPPAGPGVVQRLVEQVLGPGTVRDPLPRAWRDGHGLLYEPDDRRQRFAFLSYLVRVAAEVRQQDPAGAAELQEWALSRGLWLPNAERGRLVELAQSPGGQSSVVVALPPVGWSDGRPDRFRWEIHLVRGPGEREVADVCDDREGVAFEDAVAQLQRPLLLALDRADGSGPPAAVEIAVPAERFDTVAHAWTLGGPVPAARRGPRRNRPMGVRRPVVLRDVDRSGAPPAEWRYRWDELAALTGLRPLPLFVLDDSPGYEKLRSAPFETVPVLCGPVGDGKGLETMLDALAAGHGVALWRTTPHPPGPCGDHCETFRRHVAGLLDSVSSAQGPSGLPELVRALRAGAYDARAGGRPAGTRWSEDIVLLYDDAGFPLPEFDGPAGRAS